jgi:hypothetical protein
MTTLGYEITAPRAPRAGLSLAGRIFLATLVARLVAAYRAPGRQR